MTDLEPPTDRFEAVLVMVLYVLPLSATVAFLALVGLPGLALALLAVEALVASAVVVAKRPSGVARGPGRLVVALLLLGLVAGAGALALLT